MLESSFSGVGHLQQDRVGRRHCHGIKMGRIIRAGTIAVSPGPTSARHMWLKPSFDPRHTNHFALGVEPHAVLLEILAATSRRRLKMPLASA